MGVVVVRVNGVAHTFGGKERALYPDDPVFAVKQRIQAFLGVPARAQRLFVGKEELAQPMALLGDVAAIEVRVEAESAGAATEEDDQEVARAREVAGILAEAREAPRGVAVGDFRFSRWQQEVPSAKPLSASALESIFQRALAANGNVHMARWVTWRGGEANVRNKVAREAGDDALAMAEGYEADPELGDIVELLVTYAPSRVAQMRVAATGAYTVEARSTFDAVSEGALATLQKAIGTIARALGLRQPDAQKDALDADLSTELRTEGRRPQGIAAVRGTIDARLYPFFSADAMPKALRLRYKRVPGFDSRTNQRDWIADHAVVGQSPDALADALRRTFLSMTRTDAREEAARVAREGIPRKTSRRMRGARMPWLGVVEARLAPASDFFGYRLTARGVTSLQQWRVMSRAAAHAIASGPASSAAKAAATPGA